MSNDDIKTHLCLAVDNNNSQPLIRIDWIERFFQLMETQHPFVWRKYLNMTCCTSKEMQAIWYKELKETTQDKFMEVLKHIDTSGDFDQHPPYLAAMKSLCRATPEDYSCPSEDEAYNLFLTRKYKQSAPVRHAVVRLNTFAVYRMSAEKNRREFLKSYRKVLDEIKGGDLSLLTYLEPVALPRKEDFIGVEHKGKSQSDLMSSIRKSLGMKKS